MSFAYNSNNRTIIPTVLYRIYKCYDCICQQTYLIHATNWQRRMQDGQKTRSLPGMLYRFELTFSDETTNHFYQRVSISLRSNWIYYRNDICISTMAAYIYSNMQVAIQCNDNATVSRSEILISLWHPKLTVNWTYSCIAFANTYIRYRPIFFYEMLSTRSWMVLISFVCWHCDFTVYVSFCVCDCSSLCYKCQSRWRIQQICTNAHPDGATNEKNQQKCSNSLRVAN